MTSAEGLEGLEGSIGEVVAVFFAGSIIFDDEGEQN
jgi:hypothetical protein